MINSNGNNVKAYGWGCVTWIAVVSIVLAFGWYAMYVRG